LEHSDQGDEKPLISGVWVRREFRRYRRFRRAAIVTASAQSCNPSFSRMFAKQTKWFWRVLALVTMGMEAELDFEF